MVWFDDRSYLMRESEREVKHSFSENKNSLKKVLTMG